MDNTLKDLSNKIQEYDFHYYVKGKPIVSNEIYDGLYEQLKYLETEAKVPEHLKVSNRVGVFDIRNNVNHITKMYSMNKTNDMEQAHAFLNQFRYDTNIVLVDTKYDGIAVELRYENGIPVKAISRGDGIVGKDITRNVFSLVDIPKSILHKGTIQIEGEIVLPKTKSNSNSNLCSVVSGLLMGKQIPSTKVSPVFIAYNYHIENSLNNRDYLTTINTLNKIWKFNTVTPVAVRWEDLDTYIQEQENIKNNFKYPADGLCIKINEYDLRVSAGHTRKYPRFAIAYKFKPPIFETTLLSVDWQVGTTGRLTPIGTIEPIYFNNKKFNKVNLHTVSKIHEHELMIGSNIEVSIKGGLIPKVIKSISTGTSEIEIPRNCPICNEPTLYVGKYLICKNNKHS